MYYGQGDGHHKGQQMHSDSAIERLQFLDIHAWHLTLLTIEVATCTV